MNPLGDRIRARRTERGQTLRGLAVLAGIRSPSFVLHIENGDKIPSPDVAERIAAALEDDPTLYRAWALLMGRASAEAALDAARIILDERGAPPPAHARFGAPGGPAWGSPPAPGDAPWPGETARPSPPSAARITDAPAHASALLRIPLLAPGADPGDGPRPACPVLDHLRVAPAHLPPLESLMRPFAYPLSAETARGVPGSVAGDYAVCARATRPPEPGAWCAVRVAGGIRLASVLWNGQHLLVLPAPGQSDFVLLPAASAPAALAHLAGAGVCCLAPAAAGRASRERTS